MYNKAIAAALSGIVGVLALFVPGIETYATPEMIMAISTVLGTALVYAIPNRTS